MVKKHISWNMSTATQIALTNEKEKFTHTKQTEHTERTENTQYKIIVFANVDATMYLVSGN